MPGMISIKNKPTMSLGRNSAMHHRTGTAGSNQFSTVRAPKAYMSQTKASLARRLSQDAPALTEFTFKCPQLENNPYDDWVKTWSSSSDESSAGEEWDVPSSASDHEWVVRYGHEITPWEIEQFHTSHAPNDDAASFWDIQQAGYCHEDTPWEIEQFHTNIAPNDEDASIEDTQQVDGWWSAEQASPVATDYPSEQSWDVNYVHSDSAWDFMQFGTRNFMEGRRMSPDPNAVWDAPIEDPIDEDVALQYRLDHEEFWHNEDGCECELDNTQIQQSRVFANDGCGIVYIACHDGPATSERVCIDCGANPCECDDDESEHTLKADNNNSGNSVSNKIHSVKYLDQRASMLIAEIDKLVTDVDYLKRQKLRFARDASRYLNIGQRFRSQLEKSNAELHNCEFRLAKSQDVQARFRSAFLHLGLMLRKYHDLGITEEQNDVLGQVRYIISPLLDLVQDDGN